MESRRAVVWGLFYLLFTSPAPLTLSLSFGPCSIHSAINAVSVIEKCIADVCSRFIGNRLMINDAKTDFLIIGTRQQIESIIIGATPSLNL